MRCTLIGSLDFPSAAVAKRQLAAWKLGEQEGGALRVDVVVDAEPAEARVTVERLCAIAARATSGRVRVEVGASLVDVHAGGGLREAVWELPAGAIARIGALALRMPGAFEIVRSPDKKRVAIGGVAWRAVEETPSRGNASRLIRTPGPLDDLLPATEVRIWDVARREEVCRVTKLRGDVLGLAFTPDGEELVAGTSAGQLACFRADTGELRWEVRRADPGRLKSVSISGDGELVVTAGTEKVARLWRRATGKPARQLRHGTSVWRAAFAADGKHILGQDVSGTFAWTLAGKRVEKQLKWPADLDLAKIITDGHIGRVRGLAFAGAKELRSVGDRTLRRWDVSDPSRPVRVAEKPIDLWHEHDGAVAIAPDGSRVVVTNYGDLVVYDGASGEKLHKLEALRDGDSLHLVLSPGGGILASSGNFNQNPCLCVWDLTSGKSLLGDRWAGTWPIYALALAPDGGRLAYAAEERGDVRVLHVGGRSADDQFCEGLHGVRWLAFARRGPRLYAITTDFRFHTVSEGGAVLESFEGPGPCAALSPDGKTLAAVDREGALGLWSVATGNRRADVAWRGHERGFSALAWSPDGKIVASGGEEGTILLWKV